MTEALQPYPAYKSSGTDWPDKTPEHWELQRLRATVASHTTGTWGLDPDGVNDLPCIRVADFDRGRLRVRADNPTLRSIKPTDRPKRTLQQGNLLLEKSGGGEKQPVGNIVLYDHQLVAVTSNFIERLTLQHDHNPAFFVYLHSALYAKGVNIRSIKQTTGIQNLDVSSYLSETIGVPDLSEQNAIVRYLDHADELISRYIGAKERLIALLEEQRKTVIHQAVTRGLHPNVSLTPSGIPSLGDVPAHWDLRRAKFTYHESDQRSYSGVEELMSVSHITGVTPRKQNVTMFLAQSNEGYKLCRPGDIVVNTMWAYMAALGVARQSGLVSPSYGVYRPRVDGLVNPEYMDLLLRTENYRVEYTRRSKGITASRLRLYPDDFLDIPFLRPPTNEQTHIVKYLRRATANVDSTIDRTHRQIALMNEYRTRLIADVVTGQIDVRNATVELPD